MELYSSGFYLEYKTLKVPLLQYREENGEFWGIIETLTQDWGHLQF